MVGMSLFTRDLSIFLLILLSRKLLFSMKLPGLQMMLSASKSRRTTYILLNYANSAFSKLLFHELETCNVPKYIQFYSTDWTMPADKIKEYRRQGYGVIYEYIDDLSPHLAGTDELPVNVKDKYEMAMSDRIFLLW